MRVLRFTISLLAAALLSAQTEDIHQRILRILGPQAEALLKNKQFAEIETMLSGAPAKTNQERSEVAALQGALEFLSGKMDGAANRFQQAAAISDLREPDRFTLAMAWVQLGHDADARRELTQLARQQPEKALYAYWLGRVDYGQRRYPEGVEHLKRATQLDPKSARAWDSLGLAYDMQGKVDESLRAFEQGVRVNREQSRPSPWPPHDLGALLLRTGELQRAQAALLEALKYEPAMPQAHFHLGRVLEKEGLNEEAVKEYISATKLDQKASDACYSLALLYRKMQRGKEAEAMFAEWRKRRDASGADPN
jgi:tetratricopeptide (TPR) repeat protein